MAMRRDIFSGPASGPIVNCGRKSLILAFASRSSQSDNIIAGRQNEAVKWIRASSLGLQVTGMKLRVKQGYVIAQLGWVRAVNVRLIPASSLVY